MLAPILWNRSIPACAGETTSYPASLFDEEVDPRMRGGDASAIGTGQGPAGRSPHARGRRSAAQRMGRIGGSIPACAGETEGSCSIRTWIEVDPRMRGGDPLMPCSEKRARGRSPHARGRHAKPMRELTARRSIPACAGETLHFNRMNYRQIVKERVNGVLPAFRRFQPT